MSYLLGASSLAGCVSLPLLSPVPSGALQVRSKSLGDIVIHPTACRSGEWQYFYGSDLIDESGGTTARLAVDPLSGGALRIFPTARPYERGLIISNSECSRFQFSIEPTGWEVNEYRDYRVTIDVDCSKGEDSVSGAITSEHCN